MANPRHLAIIEKSIKSRNMSSWNTWLAKQRSRKWDFRPDLSNCDFSSANLSGSNLSYADLVGSNFTNAYLGLSQCANADFTGSNFAGADLTACDLSNAKLIDANFSNGNLSYAILSNADLTNADLSRTELFGTNFFRAELANINIGTAHIGLTIFASVNLSTAIGLGSIRHRSPSTVGVDTLYLSQGNIPEVFLRGCGLPEKAVAFSKSLAGKTVHYYSAFISFSFQDETFARRLYNELQLNDVRVWFAPEDIKIGEAIEDSIDQAIRVYDKLILVISRNSIGRAWVRKEFLTAIVKEKRYAKTVLFPIRLDDAVFETTEQWAYDLKDRHIGDFREWTNPLKYQTAFKRLLRDLNAGA